MNNLKYKILFMVSMFLLIFQGLFIPQCWCESIYDDMVIVNSNHEDVQTSNNQSQVNEIPATSGYQNNSKAVGKTGSITSYAKLADDLGNSDLSTKCHILMAAGATPAEVQIVLVGKGYNADDVNKALGGNKSNTSNTNHFLSNGNNSQTASGNNNTTTTTSSGTSGTSTYSNTVVQDPTSGNVSTSSNNTQVVNTTTVNGSGSSNNTQVVNLTTGNNEDQNYIVPPYSEDNQTQTGGVTVNDDRPGKANAEDIANIKQQLVDAQNLFKSLGFDAKNITVDIVDEDGSGKGAEAGIGKDGSLHINLYVSIGKDGHYTQGGGDVQVGGMIHEYAHLVYETQTGGGFSHETNGTDVNESQALNEGFAMYWGEGQNGNGLPDLAGTAQDTPQKNADLNFARALTDLAKDIGYDKANALIMTAYSLMDGNFTFAGAKDALIKADQKLYGGANAQNINNALGKV